MKIALVYPDLSHKGGAESVVVWTAAGLARRGHEVAVFTGAAEPAHWPGQAGWAGNLQLVEAERSGQRLTRHRRTGAVLAPRLADFDVVYAHNRYGLLWALDAPGPLYWYCQEPSRRLHVRATDRFLFEALARPDTDRRHPALRQLRKLLRRPRWNPKYALDLRARRRKDREWVVRPREVFVNSRFSAGVFEEALGRRPLVLDLGVPDPGPPAPAGERAGVAVVTTGNPRKNLYGVLAAARELERGGRLPGERFHVWGVRADDESVLRLVQDWGLSRRVVLHGFLDDRAARERMARSRMCLFLPLCEPFGLVAVEALLAGVPVLASDHGGPAEILERCGGGRTVDPLRPAEVALAIEDLFAGQHDWERQAAAAGARAREIYGMERYLDRTEELLGLRESQEVA